MTKPIIPSKGGSYTRAKSGDLTRKAGTKQLGKPKKKPEKQKVEDK